MTHLLYLKASMREGKAMANRQQQVVRNRRQNRCSSSACGGGHSEISCCVKYTVFGFNVIFWIIGFLLLSVGVWAHNEKYNPDSQVSHISKFYLNPAWLLIIIGVVTFTLGFSGCVGALRENTCFLAIYSSLLGLLLLAEAVIVIVAILSKDWIETELKVKFNDMVVLYRDDVDLQSLIDWMQTDWKCCGINKADDWEMNIYFNSTSQEIKSVEAGGVPFSCCLPKYKYRSEGLPNSNCGHGVRVKELRKAMHDIIYVEGCFPKALQWLNSNFVYVGTAIFVVAVIQFLGICFAQDLRSDIFAQRSKWNRRCCERSLPSHFSDAFQQYLLDEIELKDEEKVELRWRRFSYQIFVFFVIIVGVPVWYYTTTPTVLLFLILMINSMTESRSYSENLFPCKLLTRREGQMCGAK
uniref:Tetraspanin n=1 Tax=Ditylenchus dipsaci TaxID=166011 RepID=A0A915DI92_9BILA